MIEFRTALKGRKLEDGTIDDDEADLMRWFDLADTMGVMIPGFSLRIVVTAPRTDSPEEVARQYKRAVELNGRHPGMIVGFGLAGDEEYDPPLSDFVPVLLEVQEKAGHKALPFVLRAGQVAGLEEGDLADALLLDARRIGPGLALGHSPYLLMEYANKDIAVELSPVLDQVLGFVADIRFHPAVAMLNSAVPVVIAPGSTGMIGSRLADSWFAAVLAWDLDIGDIKAMAINSFSYSGLTEIERQRALVQWQSRWEEFIAALGQLPVPTQ